MSTHRFTGQGTVRPAKHKGLCSRLQCMLSESYALNNDKLTAPTYINGLTAGV